MIAGGEHSIPNATQQSPGTMSFTAYCIGLLYQEIATGLTSLAMTGLMNVQSPTIQCILTGGAMKKFRCVPIAMGVPVIFGMFSLFWVPLLFRLDLFVNSQGEPAPMLGLFVCLFAMSLCLSVALAFLKVALRRVEILPDKVVCKGIFPKDTFEMPYDACSMGMDYHVQNNGKIWWIYFYSGEHPKYKTKNPASRINSVKIQPGFVRIMYSEELFQTLMDTLPAKQCTTLQSIRRCAGFEKQGKII